MNRIRGWETWADRFIAALPGKVFATVFGVNCECKVAEHGMQVNGHYLVLETRSVPEGYQVRFPLFDESIKTELGSNVERTYTNLHHYEMHDILCFDASPEAAQYLVDQFDWEVIKDYGEWDYTMRVSSTGYEVDAIIEYLETCWHTA